MPAATKRTNVTTALAFGERNVPNFFSLRALIGGANISAMISSGRAARRLVTPNGIAMIKKKIEASEFRVIQTYAIALRGPETDGGAAGIGGGMGLLGSRRTSSV